MNDPMQSAPAGNRGASRNVRAGHPENTPTLDLFDSTAPNVARHRRDDGMSAADAAEDVRIRSARRSAIERLAATGETFTSDDTNADVGIGNPKAVGAAFRAAAREGLIECVGVTTSQRASRHGGLVRVWRGTGAA